MSEFKKAFDDVLSEVSALDQRSQFAYLLHDFVSSIDVALRQALVECGKIHHKDLDTAYNQYVGSSPRETIALTYQSAMVHAAQFVQMFMKDFKDGALAEVSEESKQALVKMAALRKTVPDGIVAP